MLRTSLGKASPQLICWYHMIQVVCLNQSCCYPLLVQICTFDSCPYPVSEKRELLLCPCLKTYGPRFSSYFSQKEGHKRLTVESLPWVTNRFLLHSKWLTTNTSQTNLSCSISAGLDLKGRNIPKKTKGEKHPKNQTCHENPPFEWWFTHPWKPTWLAGKSPVLIGTTSSPAGFSIVMRVFRRLVIPS